MMMTINEIKNDAKINGEKILDRKMTEAEVKENSQALVDYFNIIFIEDCDEDEEASRALFNENFYDKLKEQLEG